MFTSENLIDMHPETIESSHLIDTKEKMITVAKAAHVVTMRSFRLLVSQCLEIAYVSNTTLG